MTSSFVSASSSLQIAFGVSGSGDAKISASRIAFSSADGRRSTFSTSSTAFLTSSSSTRSLRIANGVRRVGRTRPLIHTNRTERAGLEHAHQLESNHLEQREKRDDQAAAIVDV